MASQRYMANWSGTGPVKLFVDVSRNDSVEPASNCCVKSAATSTSSSVTPLVRSPLHPAPLKSPPNVQSSDPLTALPPPKSKADNETVLALPSEFVSPNPSVWIPDNGEVSTKTRIESAWALVATQRTVNRQDEHSKQPDDHDLLLPRTRTGKHASLVGHGDVPGLVNCSCTETLCPGDRFVSTLMYGLPAGRISDVPPLGL